MPAGGDAATGLLPLGGEAVYDPAGSPQQPRPAPTRLRPQQAVVLTTGTAPGAAQPAGSGGRWRGVTRSRSTLTLYAALGCLGYLLNGLGAVLPELRDELALSRLEVAMYPAGFALGLLIVGSVGDRLAHLLRRRALPAALVLMGSGALLLSAANRGLSGAGALLLGLGGAGLVQVVPAGLRAEHGQRAVVAIGEANAVSSLASAVAPPLIGAAIAAGIGWRVGYVAVPLAAIVAVGAAAVRAAPAGGPPPRGDRAGRARGPDLSMPREFIGRWVDVLLAVAVEFCLVFWAADDLRTQHGLPAGLAVATAGLLLLGMAIGRAVSAAVLRLFPATARVLALTCGVATGGFALLWAVGNPSVAAGGLFLTGLGIALLYPITVAEALTVWPANPARAAARCALASGLAIGAAPLLLGALADLAGLRTALLLVPALLGTIAARCTVRLATAQP